MNETVKDTTASGHQEIASAELGARAIHVKRHHWTHSWIPRLSFRSFFLFCLLASIWIGQSGLERRLRQDQVELGQLRVATGFFEVNEPGQISGVRKHVPFSEGRHWEIYLPEHRSYEICMSNEVESYSSVRIEKQEIELKAAVRYPIASGRHHLEMRYRELDSQGHISKLELLVDESQALPIPLFEKANIRPYSIRSSVLQGLGFYCVDAPAETEVVLYRQQHGRLSNDLQGIYIWFESKKSE